MFSIQEVKYRIHCDVCNKFYKRHLKSQGHINNFKFLF